MKRILAFILCTSIRAADLPVVDGNVITVMGDSITLPNSGTWVYYFHSCMVNKHPDKTLHIYNLARSGSALSGWLDGAGSSDEEFRKWIVPLQPDYVVMSTMVNGGVPAATNYLTNLQDVTDNYIIGLCGAVPVFTGEYPDPSPTGGAWQAFDDKHRTVAQAADPDHMYFHMFDALSPLWTTKVQITAEADDDTFTATSHGLTNGTRIFFIMGGNPAGPTGVSSWQYYYVINATTNTFQVSTTQGGSAANVLTDGNPGHLSYASWVWPIVTYTTGGDAHPSHVAGVIYAFKWMTGVGFSSAVCDATINGSNATLVSDNDCTVTSVTANGFNGVDFSMLPHRLEWAVHDELIDDAETLIPGCTSWQTRTLTVSGLAAGNYEILEGGILIGTVSHTQLGAGVNLAAFHVGPTFDQKQDILDAISDVMGNGHDSLAQLGGNPGIHNYRSNANGSYPTNYGAAGAAAHAAALADEITALYVLDDAVHDAVQPTTRSYSVRQVVSGSTLTTSTLNIGSP